MKYVFIVFDLWTGAWDLAVRATLALSSDNVTLYSTSCPTPGL